MGFSFPIFIRYFHVSKILCWIIPVRAERILWSCVMYVNLVDYRWCNCISCNTLTCNYIYPAFIIVSREKFHGEGMDEIISLRRTRIVFYCVPFSSNRVCCAHIYLILEKPRALSRPIKYLFPSQFHFPRFIRIWQMIVTFADILSRKKNIDFAIPRPLRISLAIFRSSPRNFNRFIQKSFPSNLNLWENKENCNKSYPLPYTSFPRLAN